MNCYNTGWRHLGSRQISYTTLLYDMERINHNYGARFITVLYPNKGNPTNLS